MTSYVQRDKWLSKNGVKSEFDTWLATDFTPPF